MRPRPECCGWAKVVRRFISGSEPVSALMMGMGLLALLANVTCLILISKKRNAGAHTKASYIFSANDVIANAGVVLAGILVALSSERCSTHPAAQMNQIAQLGMQLPSSRYRADRDRGNSPD